MPWKKTVFSRQELKVPMEEKLFDAFEKVSRQQWQKKIITDLKGKDYEGLLWNAAGLSGEPIYTKEDLPENIPNLANVHEQPDLFGDRHWVNFQWIKVNQPKEANTKALQALNQGAGGIIFELDTEPEWHVLLQEIKLKYCHLGLVDNHVGSGCAKSFFDYCSAQNITPDQLKGFYTGPGTAPSAYENFNSINLKINEDLTNGMPAIELACLLAEATDLYDQLTESGNSAPDLIRQTQFQMSMGSSYFVEIAKYRAMRGLVIKFASAYGLALSPGDVQIMAMSSDWRDALDDPHSHMLHATTQAMSAIMGGADAVCIKPFYPVFDQKNLAERAARNISSILSEESYLAKVIDPAAGTYYIESLTQQLSVQAWKLFLAIEEAGGLKAVDAATVQALYHKTEA